MTEDVTEVQDGAPAKKDADPELVALRKIGAILAKLTESGRRRVLGFYVDREV